MTAAVYTSRQAARISGLSLRQLAYWRKCGLLLPSQRTRGGHSRYSFTDLIALKSARQLLDAGVPTQRIRTAITSLQRLLPTLGGSLAGVSLVTTGDVILVLHEGSAFEALSGQHWVFPVARIEEEIHRFHGETQSPPPRQGELFPELPMAQPYTNSAK